MRWKRFLWSLGVGLVIAGHPLFAAAPPGAAELLPGPKASHGAPASPPCLTPQYMPRAPGEVTPPEQPGAVPPITEPSALTPGTDAFAQAPEAGTAGAGPSFAPNMIGDTPGGACGTAMFEGRISAMIDHPTFSCSQIKIAENNSPMPRDRVFFTYQGFYDATNLLLVETDSNRTFHKSLDINRYTFGVEKTFFNGLASVEVLLPVNTQLTRNLEVNSDIPNVTSNDRTEIGNLSVALKALLCDSDAFHFSSGLLIHTPTAPDVRIHDVEQNFDEPPVNSIDNRFRYRNQAVILSPFIGFLVEPNERLFSQGFVEVDVDPNGNRLDIQPSTNGIPGAPLSFREHQQTLLRMDLGLGYWIYRNREASGITGIAPLIEAHYTTTLDNAELAQFQRAPNNTVLLGNVANRLDIWNLVVGTTVEAGNRATLAVAGVIPLSSGDNKPFDWELNVQLNYRFGPRGCR